MRLHIDVIRNPRIENVLNYQSCMVSQLGSEIETFFFLFLAVVVGAVGTAAETKIAVKILATMIISHLFASVHIYPQIKIKQLN